MRTLTAHNSGMTRSLGIGRRGFCVLTLACALLAPLAAGVSVAQAKEKTPTAAVPESLLESAQANPKGAFDVIVLGDGSKKSDKLAAKLAKDLEKGASANDLGTQLKAQFSSVSGVHLSLSGKELLKLAKSAGILSITPNADVAPEGYANVQSWDESVGATSYWASPHASTPAATIVVVDSGVDNSSGQFDDRLLASVDLGAGHASGDPRGHGTFVAALAAGNGRYLTGAAPTAKIVSLNVFNGAGQAKSSDVIRAADWILEHKDEYQIRVANFSLLTGMLTSFTLDPLDQAVERLWRAGIVVVASSGNYASGGKPSGVWFAPGNDPFIVTVGALDVNKTTKPEDDFNAPWSAYGYTADGFMKPEISAPGRYLIAQVPSNARLLSEFVKNIVSPGYLQLSGTSFSAPIVSGIAANLLGVNPEWTPDQVKGALMSSATPLKSAAGNSEGVGEVNLQRALSISNPPNPNAALNQFLVADPAGGALPVFDGEAWADAARTNPAWNAASWTSASWTSASWTSASWTSASWTSASWSNASWNNASWASNAGGDGKGSG